VVEEARVGALAQKGAGVRFDWGPVAARLLDDPAGALVVVDTLSFTTAVSVATGRGIAVVPHPLGGAGAAARAAAHGAALAVRRADLSDAHPWSLSPRSLAEAPYTARLVLPSPNGSAIAAGAADAERDGAVLAACLRNVGASARWLRQAGFGTPERPVTVVAAGERWPDGSLRAGVEDLLGAGALVDRLVRGGCAASPEAAVAGAAFRAAGDLLATLEGCASGRELAEMGFVDEPALAAALDADGLASVPMEGMFVRA
jgi:2-phosphosulfolactate phosphatase